MSCSIEIIDKKTKTYRLCRHKPIISGITLINGEINELCCCRQHKQAMINKFVRDDKYQKDYNVRNYEFNEIINIHVVLYNIDTKVAFDHLHLGTVQFGPKTEKEHLDEIYDEYHTEYSLIEMYRLQNESDDWYQRYNNCIYNMNIIQKRMNEI